MTQPTIGWIGLGNIGLPMARRVLRAGHALRVWARRPDAADALAAEGALRVDDAQALARTCDIVVTVLKGPDDVLAVYPRMLPCAPPGTVFLEMTTASASTAAQLDRWAQGTQASVLDCPVTGGVAGAQRGTLTIFVGGDDRALTRSRPVLQTLGNRIVACGPAGAGYRMKLLNQTIMAGALLGLADGAALARAMGVTADRAIDALGSGTASGPLFQSYFPRMIERGGANTFTLGLLRKDLRLARDEAHEQDASTRLLDFALAYVDEACRRFGETAGVQNLAWLDSPPAD